MAKHRKAYDKFKKFLSINKIRQKELAERLGKSHSFVNNALNGRGAEFTPEDFIRIRCLFEIKINEYF